MINDDINRFLKAQEHVYTTALMEIQQGRKRSHWMWYIFPQIQGLGRSETAIFYSIRNLEEAQNYLHHPILGFRLKEITQALIHLEQTDATVIFGSPDDMKLKSSMTLFDYFSDTSESVFKAVLDKFFDGSKDERTLALIRE